MKTHRNVCSIPVWIALVLGLYVLSVGPFERLSNHSDWLWRYRWIYQPVDLVGKLPAVRRIYFTYLGLWTGQSPEARMIEHNLGFD